MIILTIKLDFFQIKQQKCAPNLKKKKTNKSDHNFNPDYKIWQKSNSPTKKPYRQNV